MDNHLFKNKYRIKSARLSGWDYSWPAWYFITICVKDFKCLLGQVVNGEMVLNEMGRAIEDYWLKIPHDFENVKLDEYVVMPNHIHGIIIIDSTREFKSRDAINRVSTGKGGVTASSNPMLKQSLGTIIRRYKGSISFVLRRRYYEYFVWQQRYYDHIIRNEKSLYQIRQYIENNPLQWHLDKLNPQNFKNL